MRFVLKAKLRRFGREDRFGDIKVWRVVLTKQNLIVANDQKCERIYSMGESRYIFLQRGCSLYQILLLN